MIAGHDQIQGADTTASILSARAFAVTQEENEVAATSREIALALNWAAVQNARIANLSFAGPSDPLIEREVVAANANGLVLVGAAGNAGPLSAPLYPAAYPEVIAVTATDRSAGSIAQQIENPHRGLGARRRCDRGARAQYLWN